MTLRMGAIAMLLIPDGRWQVHSDALHQHARKDEVAAVSQEVRRLAAQQQAWHEELAALEQQRLELERKNSILTDMVAEGDILNDRLSDELEQSHVVCEALKWYVSSALTKTNTHARCCLPKHVRLVPDESASSHFCTLWRAYQLVCSFTSGETMLDACVFILQEARS